MIDTDKYEWDSKCRMVVINGELYHRGNNEDYHLTLHDKAVAQLIADAPLLLEEVKRLRKYAELVADIGDMIYENSNSYELTWDEFNEMLKEMIE